MNLKVIEWAFFMLMLPILLSAQDIEVSFQSGGIANTIDQVLVINISTGGSVFVVGDHKIILRSPLNAMLGCSIRCIKD